MPEKSGAARSTPEQRAKFEEAARQLGCEESEAHFTENLRRVARLGPAPCQRRQRSRSHKPVKASPTP